MAEGQFLFTSDYNQFNEILSHQNWFNLQHEFERARTFLSQSFLIWRGETGNTWLLADFETKKTYDIERGVEPEKPARVEILYCPRKFRPLSNIRLCYNDDLL